MATAEATDDRFVRALQRLTQLGPPSELLERAPVEATAVLDLDRVLLSRIDNGLLIPQSLHSTTAREHGELDLDALGMAPVALEYPLTEGEILRRHRAQVVRHSELGPPGRRTYIDAVGWGDYVAAPVEVAGRAVGMLHGERREGPPLADHDAVDLGAFALCFGVVYERAVLRRRLRAQQQEMQRIASWAAARTADLSDRAVTLQTDGRLGREAASSGAAGDHRLRNLLTRRELDVLELMVKGRTNGDIARELVVSQGTVKFHVKNILRKLHASNRAEATSRYLRLTLNASGPSVGG